MSPIVINSENGSAFWLFCCTAFHPEDIPPTHCFAMVSEDLKTHKEQRLHTANSTVPCHGTVDIIVMTAV